MIEWFNDPGKWNDAVVYCAIIVVAVIAALAFIEDDE